ncbi:MAG: membrane dipeptidase, partial [Gemmatimonadaceae bacterium]|nr:membrane dipeptidase [Gemmatimonadaceae bacterium]
MRRTLPAVLLVVAACVRTPVAAPAPTATDDPNLARAYRVLAASPLIDGHNDLPWAIREWKEHPHDVEQYDLRRPVPGHTDLARLAAGRVGGQFWSVYIPGDTSVARQGYAKVQLEQIDIAKRVMAKYPERFEPVTTAQGFTDAFARGHIGGALGLEGGHAIENSLGALRAFYDMGGRYMTLTHN